jgi:hypothetical protein
MKMFEVSFLTIEERKIPEYKLLMKMVLQDVRQLLQLRCRVLISVIMRLESVLVRL